MSTDDLLRQFSSNRNRRKATGVKRAQNTRVPESGQTEELEEFKSPFAQFPFAFSSPATASFGPAPAQDQYGMPTFVPQSQAQVYQSQPYQGGYGLFVKQDDLELERRITHLEAESGALRAEIELHQAKIQKLEQYFAVFFNKLANLEKKFAPLS